MNAPKVSVIMPVYNQSDYLAAAIQSVVNQTLADWELIIVDDGSTDSTANVAAQFHDSRIRYIYQANQGPSQARNVGIANSRGKYLTFLDADDLYHPDKTEVQVAHLDKKTYIGLSYVLHIEMDCQGCYLSFIQSPLTTSIETLALEWPFSMNDFMVRRDWVERIGYFDKSIHVNEDREFFLRLALGGCQFEGVGRFLTFRRLYSGKVLKNLPQKLDTMLHVLDRLFADPRCPVNVFSIRETAYSKVYLSLCYQGFIQGDTSVAQKYLRKALRLNPSLQDNGANQFLTFLINASVHDGSDHETALYKTFTQLPEEMIWLQEHCKWAIARGYLQRSVQEIMWDRLEQGQMHINHAAKLGAKVDKQFFQSLSQQLLYYEMTFGTARTLKVMQNLSFYLRDVTSQTDIRWFQGYFSVNQAFQSYRQNAYARTIPSALRAIYHNPAYLINRGVAAILIRSAVGMVRNNLRTV